MELLVLAIPRRNALGRIASLTERPSKNKAEQSEAERPRSVLPGRSAVARSSSELNGTSSELVGRFWAVLSDRVSGKLP